jgi:hypothetical protein
VTIPPAPSLSGGRLGAGDGGGPGNWRADVYRLASYLSRPRLCSPLVLAGRARVCRGVTILDGLLFLAASARRRRRRRRRTTSPGLFLAPVTFYSGVNGEVAERCTGVRAGRRGSDGSFLHGCRGGCGYRGWKVSGSSSRSPQRRTPAAIQGQRSLGCVPSRWICSDGFIYCGSCQSLCAKELLLIQGHGGFVGSSSWRRRPLEFSGEHRVQGP